MNIVYFNRPIRQDKWIENYIGYNIWINLLGHVKSVAKVGRCGDYLMLDEKYPSAKLGIPTPSKGFFMESFYRASKLSNFVDLVLYKMKIKPKNRLKLMNYLFNRDTQENHIAK